MAAAMRAQAHPAAAEELAALVVEASGRATREQFLAEVAAAAEPVDREATGWFESAGTPAGGPSVQRRVDRRTKRMEAYPPIDRKAHPPAEQRGTAGSPSAPAAAPASDLFSDPDDARPKGPRPGGAGDASSNGRAPGLPDPPEARSGPPDDQDAGP